MRPKSLMDIEREIVPKSKHQYLFRAFDQVGDIAIIDVPEQLVPYEKRIAEALIDQHKTIKTVCKKIGQRVGRYRRQKLKILAGRRSKTTVHKESGVELMVHVEKVYFSPRLSTERKRIADLVEPGENVLVLFSGCAPYPCVIAKNAKPKHVTAVELNPIAHEYAVENIRRNRLQDEVTLIQGDVRKVLPKLHEHYDRIVMALPFGGESFLDVAIAAADRGTKIHFYDFGTLEEFPVVEQKVLDACQEAKRKCRIIQTRKCGQNAPRSYRIVVDFEMLD